MRIDLIGDKGAAEIGVRLEAAELVLGIIEEDREQDLALVGNDQRPVVGDELGEQREDEENEEDDKRPGAAPVAAEIVEPPLVHGRQPRTALQARAGFRLLPRVCPFVQRNAGMRLFARLRSGVGVRREAVRIDQAHTSRVSKSMRGSIQV